ERHARFRKRGADRAFSRRPAGRLDSGFARASFHDRSASLRYHRRRHLRRAQRAGTARYQADRLRLMRLLFLIVSGVLIGLVLHIVSLLAVPTLAPRDAYSRLAAFTGVNEAAALDVADAEKSLPFLDPAFAYMACRFDVSSGPLQIRVPLAGRYVAVSFHSRD